MTTLIMAFALIGMITVCIIVGVFVSPIILWLLSFLIDFAVNLFCSPNYQKHKFKKAYYSALSENPPNMVINKVYKMIPKIFRRHISAPIFPFVICILWSVGITSYVILCTERTPRDILGGVAIVALMVLFFLTRDLKYLKRIICSCYLFFRTILRNSRQSKKQKPADEKEGE